MYKIGKLLYITSSGWYIHCDNDRLVLKRDDITKAFPLSDVAEIVVFTDDTTLSVYIMKRLARENISVHYISLYGNYVGSFVNHNRSNVMLRRLQFEMIDTEKSLRFSKNLINAKFKNSVYLLKYFGHHSTSKSDIDAVCDNIKKSANHLCDCNSFAEIRTIEANVAARYFSMFDNLIKSTDDMKFYNRSQHPAVNNFNALLNFMYTMMTCLCDSALVAAGLDSECGFLHTLRSGRQSLACDLVEEFRAVYVDKFVISNVNRKVIKSDDFISENSRILLSDDGRKKCLQHWNNFLDEEIYFRYFDKNMSRKVIVFEQARILAQYVRGDVAEYIPFTSDLRK